MIASIKEGALKIGLKEVVWVICAMIVPLTIWFVAISYKIDNVKYEFVVVRTMAESNRMEIRELDNKVSNKLDKIISELGEVRGQLKRAEQ